MNQKKHIFIIDDDQEIAMLIRDYLEKNNYRVTTAYNGNHISQLFSGNQFDLVILDVMLPGKDGLSLCIEIRQLSELPIIMLSAADTEADRVAGLELGADDYVSKPFSARELLARVKSQLRRTSGELATPQHLIPKYDQIRFGPWLLDKNTHSLIGEDNIIIALSRREYDLLNIFIQNPNRILSRNQLMDKIYDKAIEPYDRSIDVLIGRVRKKIEIDPKKPKLLTTVRGGGYQLLAKVGLVP